MIGRGLQRLEPSYDHLVVDSAAGLSRQTVAFCRSVRYVAPRHHTRRHGDDRCVRLPQGVRGSARPRGSLVRCRTSWSTERRARRRRSRLPAGSRTSSGSSSARRSSCSPCPSTTARPSGRSSVGAPSSTANPIPICPAPSRSSRARRPRARRSGTRAAGAGDDESRRPGRRPAPFEEAARRRAAPSPAGRPCRRDAEDTSAEVTRRRAGLLTRRHSRRDLLLRLMAGQIPPEPAPSPFPLLASPRALRRADGAGAIRATATARASWRLGPDTGSEQIPGRPATAEAARRPSLPRAPEAYTQGSASPMTDPDLQTAIDDLVRRALAEDLGLPVTSETNADELVQRDLTTRTAVPEGARGWATLVAKQSGVFAGGGRPGARFQLLDPTSRWRRDRRRRARGSRGHRPHRQGRCARTARCGADRPQHRPAHVGCRFADAARGRHGSRDVRSHLGHAQDDAGTRMLDKYAVRVGGGTNHRIGLFDEVMVKENHVGAQVSLRRRGARRHPQRRGGRGHDHPRGTGRRGGGGRRARGRRRRPARQHERRVAQRLDLAGLRVDSRVAEDGERGRSRLPAASPRRPPGGGRQQRRRPYLHGCAHPPRSRPARS